MLIFTLRVSESKRIDDNTVVTLLGVKGDVARIGVSEYTAGEAGEGDWPDENDAGKSGE